MFKSSAVSSASVHTPLKMRYRVKKACNSHIYLILEVVIVSKNFYFESGLTLASSRKYFVTCNCCKIFKFE